MVQYRILTSKYDEILKSNIKDARQLPYDITGKWKVTIKEDMYIFSFECANRDEKLLLETLATIMSNIVQSYILTKFAEEYLKERKDLTIKEKEEIESMFILNNYVAKEEGVSYISYYLLYTPILRSLEKHTLLNIDGWILFRTHQYKVILEDIIEQTIYDYEMQKDYLRFINLLRESRKVQESLESTLHLIPGEDTSMRVLNTNKQDVTEEFINKYCIDLIKDSEVTHEDIIMNIFITVCPEKVVIHNKKRYGNLQFIETLEMIFEGQIEYCEGCLECLYTKNILGE